MSVFSQIVQVSENTSSWSLFTTEVMVTLDDLLNCCRIIQRAEVTQLLQVALHHLSQHPAHYLAWACLWQTLDKLWEWPRKCKGIKYELVLNIFLQCEVGGTELPGCSPDRHTWRSFWIRCCLAVGTHPPPGYPHLFSAPQRHTHLTKQRERKVSLLWWMFLANILRVFFGHSWRVCETHFLTELY